MRSFVLVALAPLFVPVGPHLFALEATASTPLKTEVATVRDAPGDDFFGYANADWLRAHPMPPDRAEYAVYSEVADLVEADVKALQPTLEADSATDPDARRAVDFMTAARLATTRAFALPPTLRTVSAALDAAASGGQVLQVSSTLQSSGVDAFYSFGAGSDLRDSDKVVPYLSQGGLSLPERDFYLNDTGSVRAAREAFPGYVAALLRHVGYGVPEAAKAGDAVLAFETGLAGISRPMEALRDAEKNYHPTTPAALRTMAPGLPWAAMTALPEGSAAGTFIVGQPEFFTQLDALIAGTPVDTLKAYVRFRALDAAAPWINAVTAAEHFEFHGRVLGGAKQQRPAESLALLARDRVLGEVIGKRYVAKRFPAAVRARYTALCETFRTVLAERFAKNPWMDAATRERALRKLALMRFKVGYPDVWTDYAKLPVTPDDYAENMLAGARFSYARDMARLGKAPDRERWYMNPHTCNAYFDPSNNELVFPAASFVVPGADLLTMDDALAYAFIGGTIGHEMTHAFDDEGRKFDGKGNLKDWWTPEAGAAFEARTKPVVARYSAVRPLPGIPINGEATLGENIADLGGLAIALDAFKRTECYKSGRTIDGKTPLQRFFLAYAHSWAGAVRPEELQKRLLSDFHAPAVVRVNLVVQNFAEFHEAFGVKPGDKLWLAPENRETIW